MKGEYSEKNQFEKIKNTKEKSQKDENNTNVDFEKSAENDFNLKEGKSFQDNLTDNSNKNLKDDEKFEDESEFEPKFESDREDFSMNEKEKQLKLTQLEVKMKDYLFTAQRLQADFDNFRKKTETRIEQANLDGRIEVISKLLPALDSFAGAKKIIKDEVVLEGLLMVEKQIVSALKSLNVEKIEAVGKAFDPNLHNALAVIEDSSLENDIVKEEYQSGYKLNDKVIRHSQVIVNKKEEK